MCGRELKHCWFAVWLRSSYNWNGILLHLCFLSSIVQRNQFCLWSADQPWKEGTLWPLWRTRLAGRRWGWPRDGWYLLPHLWWWTLWFHGWPGGSLQEWRPEERRGHGPPTQVRHLHIRLLEFNVLCSFLHRFVLKWVKTFLMFSTCVWSPAPLSSI